MYIFGPFFTIEYHFSFLRVAVGACHRSRRGPHYGGGVEREDVEARLLTRGMASVIAATHAARRDAHGSRDGPDPGGSRRPRREWLVKQSVVLLMLRNPKELVFTQHILLHDAGQPLRHWGSLLTSP